MASPDSCSPRTRGWSGDWALLVHSGLVLPAHAGMVPVRIMQMLLNERAPRARGDGPLLRKVMRVGTECSPRTRGWSLRQDQPRQGGPVLPAHAGMVPCRRTR